MLDANFVLYHLALSSRNAQDIALVNLAIEKTTERALAVAVAVDMCGNPELVLRRVVHISTSPPTSFTSLFNLNRIL